MTGAAEDAIVREMHVDAAPSDGFPYFAEAEKLAAWKAVTAQARAVPGGTFRMDVTGRGDVAIVSYVEVDPRTGWCSPGHGRATPRPAPSPG
jgi:uncharacterized protein YndB with AHSA1/START domain